MGVKMNNKASIDVVLLVFMTVVLSGFALFTFISNSNQVGGQIKDVKFLDNFYVNEGKIEFYINNVMDETIEGVGKVNSEGDFIKEFNKNFEKYLDQDVFLLFDFEEDLATEKNVWIEEDKIFFEVSFNMNDKFGEELKVSYIFKKVFVSRNLTKTIS